MSTDSETLACTEDRRIITTAAESYFAQFDESSIPSIDPIVPGRIGVNPEATLVEVGLLAPHPNSTTSMPTVWSPPKPVRSAADTLTSSSLEVVPSLV